jgi:hypothetical protein
MEMAKGYKKSSRKRSHSNGGISPLTLAVIIVIGFVVYCMLFGAQTDKAMKNSGMFAPGDGWVGFGIHASTNEELGKK